MIRENSRARKKMRMLIKLDSRVGKHFLRTDVGRDSRSQKVLDDLRMILESSSVREVNKVRLVGVS